MRSLLLLFFLVEALRPCTPCPAPCTCKPMGSSSERLRVKCSKDIQDIRKVDLNSKSTQLFVLDLSKNSIDIIEPGVFKNLTNIRRLNLAYNKISTLEEGCFNGLENLEKL